MVWIVSALIGVVAGVMGGLFGIGGGVIIVPALILLLGLSQHTAQGTSLAIFLVPVGLLGVMNYYRAGYVDVPKAAVLAAGVVVGSFLGSKIAVGLEPASMRRAFAVFLACMAVYLFFRP
jgi:uncharacterized membrane protein YfcA